MEADTLFMLLSAGLLLSIGFALWYTGVREDTPEKIAEINDKLLIFDYGFNIKKISLESVYNKNNERIYDKNFVVVYLNIINEGKKPIKIFTTEYKKDFKIIDGKNREYMCQSEYYLVSKQLNRKQGPLGEGIELIQPGGFYEAPLIFEVPSIKKTADIQNNGLRLEICRGEPYNRQCQLIWLS